MKNINASFLLRLKYRYKLDNLLKNSNTIINNDIIRFLRSL